MSEEKRQSWTEKELSRREFLKGLGLGVASVGVLTSLKGASVAFTRPEVEVVFATANVPASTEPHIDGADIWQRRKPLLYENLFKPGFDLLPQPELAESYEMRSLTEYVFKVRQGVRFSNGQGMDAEDIKYTLERVRNPDVGSGGAGDLGMIDQIEVIDKYTLRFTLKKPIATDLFLLYLGGKYNGTIPKDFLPTITSRALATTSMGTGPFKIVEFIPNQKMVLERNEYYWQEGKPYIDRLIFLAVPDESSIVAGLRAGELDMADFWQGINYYRVKSEPNLTTLRVPSLTLKAVDCAGDTPPTNDKRVRLAIQLGIDRGDILKIVGMNLGSRLGIIPPGMSFYALPWTELPNQERDVARARQLLDEAGLPDTFEFKLRSIVGYPDLSAAAEIIADQLQAIGMRVKVETVDIGLWIKDWTEFKEPTTMNAWGGFVDPDQYLYRHFRSQPEGKDFRRWRNPEADALLDAGRYTMDRNERKRIYNELQILMANDGITIPLFSPDLIYSFQNTIKDFQPHPTGHYYGLPFIKKG
jgi:peptide/nickel transport system substrate-binding protein